MRVTTPLNHIKSNINSINNNGFKLYSTSVPKDLSSLKSLYKKLKFQSFNSEFDFTLKNYLPNINRVFTHKEVNLKYIQVFGYDYDYTLANYTSELPNTIYSLILNQLVNRLNYPKQLLEKKYDPYFAIRGLHFDVTTGCLMKVDAYHNIQVNTVYFGREPLDNTQKLLDLHKGTHISPSYMRDNLVQLNDMFSLPEICLLADIIQYFKDQKIQFHPRNLYNDVRSCAESIHAPSDHMPHGVGMLHSLMIKNIDQYLKPSPKLVTYLSNLREKGKKTFLLTNSAYSFVDKGLSYITGNKDWSELFDVAIAGSRKPRFYNWTMPFRQLNIDKSNGQVDLGLSAVSHFERGRIYQGGNVKDFSNITGWTGQKVLYIGDHIYSDLVDPTAQEGWRTGAIVNELDQEITLSNLPESRHKVTWVNNIEHLLRLSQSLKSNQMSNLGEMNRFIEQLHNERKEMRLKLKRVVNYQFGSVFRTHNNPSYFANKIRTYADLYTSRLDNFELYPDDYVFYPKRGILPHEYVTLDRSLS